jgi:ABC-type Fe3+/spermidine/putrescine transport system ATPase subunit
VSAFVRLDGLDKRFGGHEVLRDVSLEVAEGEILALLGPSGSGKTTLLRLLAGFEQPDAGRVSIAGKEVTGLPPARRGVGMVFQHYALFPHLPVAGNVAFGLEGRGLAKADVAHRVRECLARVGLEGFEKRRIAELSGGQQQRVALARALAPEPRVLLLDEPLSNLDPALRERTRRQLKRTIREVGITTLLVTHEQEEAFDLGDRVAVLHAGRLDQVGRPEELYRDPATLFVARFIGRASLLSGVVTAVEGLHHWLRLDGPEGLEIGGVAQEQLPPGTRVEAVVRPEGLQLRPEATPATLTGRVVDRRFAGLGTYYAVALDRGGEVEVLMGARAASEGERVGVAFATEAMPPRLFPREE